MNNYKKALGYMYNQLPMFHRIGAAAYKANLNNTIKILDLLDNPQNKFKSIHIAGTNGKGSVSHYLASIFQEAGYKTALYTSPHLKDFRERIKIDGIPIPKKHVYSFIFKYLDEFEKIKPSFFEMTVGLAFEFFAKEKVDIAIIETGLGGRLDSTNLIDPELSIITNIGFDHTQFLGDTLDKIAFEKAGIIKPKKPVIIGETLNETKKVFIDKSTELDAPIIFAEDSFKVKSYRLKKSYLNLIVNRIADDKNIKINSGLTGLYQIKNIKTVLTAAETAKALGYPLKNKHVRNGIKNVVKNTGLMGRWQVLSKNPLTICDTGHNEDGIKYILNQLELLKYKKLHFVLGMVNDKDIDKILDLLPKNAVYYFCKANIPRGLDADLLSEIAISKGLRGKIYKSVKSALKAAKKEAQKDDLIFIGGSTFIVAEVL